MTTHRSDRAERTAANETLPLALPASARGGVWPIVGAACPRPASARLRLHHGRLEKEDFDFRAGGPDALYLGADEATAVLVDRTNGSSQQLASLVPGVRSMALRKDGYALFRLCPSCGGGTKDGYLEWGKVERTGGVLSLKRERRGKVWTNTSDFDRPNVMLGAAHVTVFSFGRKHGETFRRSDGRSLDQHSDRSCVAMNDRFVASAVGRTLFTRKLK